MKTLKQIILESGPSGAVYETINSSKVERILKQQKSYELLKIFTGREDSYKAYIYLPPKDKKMVVDKEALRPIWGSSSDPYENVMHHFGIAFEESTSAPETNASNVALIQKWKNKKWLVIVLLKDFTNIPLLKRKFSANDLVAKGNDYTYYKLSSLTTSMDDVGDDEQTAAAKDKKIDDNNQKWHNWIPKPTKDLGFEDEHGQFITKIRQIVGLPGQKIIFDKELETVLKAWQKKRNIPVTGVWDNASEKAAEDLLTGKIYRSYDDRDESLKVTTALSEPEIKKALGTEEPEKTKTTTTTTTKTESTMPFQNTCESFNFRTWLRASTNYNDNVDKSEKVDKEGKTSFLKKAWAVHGTQYLADDGYKKIENCDRNEKGVKVVVTVIKKKNGDNGDNGGGDNGDNGGTKKDIP